MRARLLELLACPSDGGSLTSVPRTTSAQGELLEGDLRCESCARTYPVRAGIPRFVSAPGYADSFGLQWNRFRAEQLDGHSGAPLSERRFWAETGWTREWIATARVVDVGCGAGRFLDVASRHAALAVGVDVSSSVDAARANLGDRLNVELVQASIFALPFRRGVLDGLYCIGVLQHTPDPIAAARALGAPVREGGLIAVTSYERRRWTLLQAKYLVRPITRRLAPRVLLRTLELVLPLLFPITDTLYRIPLAGRVFQFMLPIANYVHERSLTRAQRYRWSLLDTFDMLAPAYDRPLTETELSAALDDAGVTDISRRAGRGLTLAGRRR